MFPKTHGKRPKENDAFVKIMRAVLRETRNCVYYTHKKLTLWLWLMKFTAIILRSTSGKISLKEGLLLLISITKLTNPTDDFWDVNLIVTQ